MDGSASAKLLVKCKLTLPLLLLCGAEEPPRRALPACRVMSNKLSKAIKHRGRLLSNNGKKKKEMKRSCAICEFMGEKASN